MFFEQDLQKKIMKKQKQILNCQENVCLILTYIVLINSHYIKVADQILTSMSITNVNTYLYLSNLLHYYHVLLRTIFIECKTLNLELITFFVFVINIFKKSKIIRLIYL